MLSQLYQPCRDDVFVNRGRKTNFQIRKQKKYILSASLFKHYTYLIVLLFANKKMIRAQFAFRIFVQRSTEENSTSQDCWEHLKYTVITFISQFFFTASNSTALLFRNYDTNKGRS